MAIKGSATIELTNADGSKEIIRHDNMITSAVNDMCKSYRGDIPPIFKITSNGASYAKALFGGILLFNDTLNDDADDYFLPSVNITGYASTEAYGGLDTARGGYNESESGVQEDGSYKFVWDFSTSQGNGTIQSLALCPAMMGRIGASDTIVSSERAIFSMANGISAPFDNNMYMLNSSGSTAGISNYSFVPVAMIDDILYAVDYQNLRLDSSYASRFILNNGGILKLYRFKVCDKTVSVCDIVGMARYIECIDVQLPSDFTSTLYAYSSEDVVAFSFDLSAGKLYAFPCYKKSDVSVNGTIKYVDINIKNGFTVTLHTFTNNTAGVIKQSGEGLTEQYRVNFCVVGEYILAISYSDSKYKLFTIKQSDNTAIKQVKWSDNSEFTSPIGLYPVFKNGKIVVWFSFGGNYDDNYYIMDMESGIIKQTNIKNMSIANNIDIGSKVLFAMAKHYLIYVPTVNPFVLTTKNNLDSPVTKTANQTMKITYTLSESAGV